MGEQAPRLEGVVSRIEARRVLGWRLRVALEDGRRETLRWYRSHLARD